MSNGELAQPAALSSSDERQLLDLESVGPATLADFHRLGIHRVEDLRGCEAEALHRQLCHVTGGRHDPRCQDVFAAAIAQALNPNLPPEQRRWPYWSRERKQTLAKAKAQSR